MIAVGIVLPWSVRTWVTTGNPVYPVFFNLFGGLTGHKKVVTVNSISAMQMSWGVNHW